VSGLVKGRHGSALAGVVLCCLQAGCRFAGTVSCDTATECPEPAASASSGAGAANGHGGSGSGSGGQPGVTVKNGGTASASGTTSAPPASSACTAPSVGQTRLRRLDREQYQRAVRDLLGLSFEPGADFPSDEKVAAFSSNTITSLDRLAVEQYLDAAMQIADLAVDNLAALTSCDRTKLGDAACADDFVATLGARAYRRPLTGDESARYAQLFSGAASFEDGARAAVTAFLTSPHFLYQEELPSAGQSGPRALDDYELATRLALALWGSVPDAELMQAAADGRLGTADQIRTEADRMLDDDRAADTLASFHLQWLGLDDIDALTKDPAAYPNFDSATPAAMRAETAAFADYVFRGTDGTLETLLAAPLAFPQGPLADIYGVTPNADPTQPVALDPTRRAGVLTQAAFLAMQAHPNQTSPVRRGVVVLRNVLCVDLPDPPPNVNNATPNLDPNATTRERFAEHTTSSQCAGCHSLIDPVGFAFEHYDAVGRYRTSENGMPIDSSGELTQADESTVAFEDAVGLAKALAVSSDVRKCVARQWFRYGLGRLETDADACSLAAIDTAFAASGYRMRALLLAVVTSDAFRYVDGGAQ